MPQALGQVENVVNVFCSAKVQQFGHCTDPPLSEGNNISRICLKCSIKYVFSV